MAPLLLATAISTHPGNWYKRCIERMAYFHLWTTHGVVRTDGSLTDIGRKSNRTVSRRPPNIIHIAITNLLRSGRRWSGLMYFCSRSDCPRPGSPAWMEQYIGFVQVLRQWDFDETKHVLVNLSVRDVIDDLNAAIKFILAKNAQARFLLTVSPVPLVATAEPRSVLVSTTYSKSVLRVAAEEVSQAYNTVAYFPSYEIITGNYTRGRYFADDLRSVTEEGVSHVMRLFMEHYASVDPEAILVVKFALTAMTGCCRNGPPDRSP